MSRSARLARAEQDAVRLCHGGLDGRGVRHDVVRAVRRVVPADAVFVATADPETLLFTGAWPATSAIRPTSWSSPGDNWLGSLSRRA
jgi:hypothetical protein